MPVSSVNASASSSASCCCTMAYMSSSSAAKAAVTPLRKKMATSSCANGRPGLRVWALFFTSYLQNTSRRYWTHVDSHIYACLLLNSKTAGIKVIHLVHHNWSHYIRQAQSRDVQRCHPESP